MTRPHGQELRPEDTPAFRQAVRDLVYLCGQEALAGVAEVIHERRRQIEDCGYSTEHDRTAHRGGWLMTQTSLRAAETIAGVTTGVDGVWETAVSLAVTAALAAAEIDRVEAEFGPREA